MKNREDVAQRHHVPELDGLRALAVLAVVAHHFFLNWGESMGSLGPPAKFAWVGVDIFFVLSGYLITGILLRNKPDRTSMGNFYAKRALRIWPLYFILLGAVCLEARFVFHRPYPWKISLVLMQNFLHWWPNMGFNQTWSLCIEEQFYFVWPFLIFYFPRRALPVILGTILVCSPMLRFAAIHHGVSSKLLYTATQYRLDPIALGSLLALAFYEGWLSKQRAGQIGKIAVPVLSALALGEIYFNRVDLGQRSALLYSFIAFASAGLVAILVSPVKGVFHTVMASAPFRYVGKISYGLYMLHPLVFGVLAHAALRPIVAAPLALVLSFGVAMLSWHFMESRLLRLKTKLPS
ncbi:MAG: acyltransferase [Acidobacteria bacterium]|nr:acyltransferase [Acidobacteriota bacterium]